MPHQAREHCLVMSDDPVTGGTSLRWIRFRQCVMDAADLPIGHLAFVLLALGGLAWTRWGALSPGDYVGAVAAGSGLLAVGHGIRHHRRP
jgi:hypothetical protein